MSTPLQWAAAFARQARADFDTWQQLQKNDSIPDCHRLLFLQMACEKLAKAHLSSLGIGSRQLQSSHAYVAKNLPVILRKELGQLRVKPGAGRAIIRHAKLLAQEIELLAPAVKRGGKRPDNCEY